MVAVTLHSSHGKAFSHGRKIANTRSETIIRSDSRGQNCCVAKVIDFQAILVERAIWVTYNVSHQKAMLRDKVNALDSKYL